MRAVSFESALWALAGTATFAAWLFARDLATYTSGSRSGAWAT